MATCLVFIACERVDPTSGLHSQPQITKSAPSLILLLPQGREKGGAGAQPRRADHAHGLHGSPRIVSESLRNGLHGIGLQDRCESRHLFRRCTKGNLDIDYYPGMSTQCQGDAQRSPGSRTSTHSGRKDHHVPLTRPRGQFIIMRGTMRVASKSGCDNTSRRIRVEAPTGVSLLITPMCNRMRRGRGGGDVTVSRNKEKTNEAFARTAMEHDLAPYERSCRYNSIFPARKHQGT